MSNLKYKSINLHYTIQGFGSAIVLLHGFLENISMWKDIIPHLAKKNKVISIDLFGHGDTENLGYIHTMEEQAKMVKFVLNHLKLRKYTFVGHSMGGYIALAFAELFPENIKKLCLMNSSAQADDDEKKRNRDRAIRAVKHSPKTFVKLAIPNLFSEANKTNFSKEIELVTQEALRTSPQGIIAAMEGMKIREDRTSILNSSDFPILMIISKLDPALAYQDLIDQTKNTSVLIQEFPDGHMSHIENKNELINTLVEFVK
ncbi:MAG: alpha/beta fold hydrolase [Flavobacteriaceae bacterium]|nr:alpha/beta fold hydrolase [Flavobacteriaceae bacterium]